MISQYCGSRRLPAVHSQQYRRMMEAITYGTNESLTKLVELFPSTVTDGMQREYHIDHDSDLDFEE